MGLAKTALIDSDHAMHAAQTVALVQSVLGPHLPDHLVNTHLHGDHCGGRVALRARYPALQTFIPPGQAQALQHWDEQALSYAPTGQHCPVFVYDGLLQPETSVQLGAHASYFRDMKFPSWIDALLAERARASLV